MHLNKYKKRGQISTEYLILLSFVVFLVISMLGVSFLYSSLAKDRIKFRNLDQFASNVIDSAESVFYSGEPSRITINPYLPEGVQGIEVLTGEIIFNVSTSSGTTRISYASNVNLAGSLSYNQGVKRISIVARASDVLVSEE